MRFDAFDARRAAVSCSSPAGPAAARRRWSTRFSQSAPKRAAGPRRPLLRAVRHGEPYLPVWEAIRSLLGAAIRPAGAGGAARASRRGRSRRPLSAHEPRTARSSEPRARRDGRRDRSAGGESAARARARRRALGRPLDARPAVGAGPPSRRDASCWSSRPTARPRCCVRRITRCARSCRNCWRRGWPRRSPLQLLDERAVAKYLRRRFAGEHAARTRSPAGCTSARRPPAVPRPPRRRPRRAGRADGSEWPVEARQRRGPTRRVAGGAGNAGPAHRAGDDRAAARAARRRASGRCSKRRRSRAWNVAAAAAAAALGDGRRRRRAGLRRPRPPAPLPRARRRRRVARRHRLDAFPLRPRAVPQRRLRADPRRPSRAASPRSGLRMEAGLGRSRAEEAAALAMHFEHRPRLAARGAAPPPRRRRRRPAVRPPRGRQYLRRASPPLERLPAATRAGARACRADVAGREPPGDPGCAAPEVEQIYARAEQLSRATGAAADVDAIFPVLWGIWVFHKVRSDLRQPTSWRGGCSTRAARRTIPPLLCRPTRRCA